MDGLQEERDVLVRGPELFRKVPSPIVMGGGNPIDRVIETLLPLLESEHHAAGDAWSVVEIERCIAPAVPELRSRRDAGVAGAFRPE